METTDKVALGIIGAWILAGLATAYGWVMNLVTLLSTETYETTTQFIVGCIGVFVAPVGALTYYIAG